MGAARHRQERWAACETRCAGGDAPKSTRCRPCIFSGTAEDPPVLNHYMPTQVHRPASRTVFLEGLRVSAARSANPVGIAHAHGPRPGRHVALCKHDDEPAATLCNCRCYIGDLAAGCLRNASFAATGGLAEYRRPPGLSASVPRTWSGVTGISFRSLT